MAKCADCQRKYPEELLDRMFVKDGYTEPICCFCAAKRMYGKVDIYDCPFRGEGNKFRWEQSIEYRLREVTVNGT